MRDREERGQRLHWSARGSETAENRYTADVCKGLAKGGRKPMILSNREEPLRQRGSDGRRADDFYRRTERVRVRRFRVRNVRARVG